MRSYQGYYTRSHQNSEVKRLWAGIVLGWVTSREVPVLHPTIFFSSPLFHPRTIRPSPHRTCTSARTNPSSSRSTSFHPIPTYHSSFILLTVNSNTYHIPHTTLN